MTVQKYTPSNANKKPANKSAHYPMSDKLNTHSTSESNEALIKINALNLNASNNNTDDIIRIMPTKADLQRPHTDQEFIDLTMEKKSSDKHNLIATSREALPEIFVNGQLIDPDSIAQEMQYHPADNKDDALYNSAQALVIRQLLQEQVLRDETLGKKAWEEDEEKAVSELLDKNVEVTAPDSNTCLRYYEQNKEQYVTDAQIKVRHILLAVAPDDEDERLRLKKLAYEIIKTINESKNKDAEFVQMVRQHSSCPSTEEGGDLGQLERGQTVPEFENKVFDLDLGLAPSPVESRYGFHIVDVVTKQSGVALNYEQSEPAISNFLTQQSFHHGLCDYLFYLVDNADIEGIKMTMTEENVHRG